MKYCFLLLALTSNVYAARTPVQFSCPIDKTLKIEISFLDQKKPSVDLFYKKTKFGTCLYNDTIYSRRKDPRAQVVADTLRLKFDSCRYYYEDQKSKIDLVSDVTFINKKGSPVSYLRIVEGMQPLRCSALK